MSVVSILIIIIYVSKYPILSLQQGKKKFKKMLCLSLCGFIYLFGEKIQGSSGNS